MQHGKQHGQSLRVKADRQPTRVAMRLIDQRLDFDQQRPRTFLRDQHTGTRHLLPVP